MKSPGRISSMKTQILRIFSKAYSHSLHVQGEVAQIQQLVKVLFTLNAITLDLYRIKTENQN